MQVSTLLSFAFFLIALPVLSLIQTPKRMPNSITEAVLKERGRLRPPGRPSGRAAPRRLIGQDRRGTSEMKKLLHSLAALGLLAATATLAHAQERSRAAAPAVNSRRSRTGRGRGSGWTCCRAASAHGRTRIINGEAAHAEGEANHAADPTHFPIKPPKKRIGRLRTVRHLRQGQPQRGLKVYKEVCSACHSRRGCRSTRWRTSAIPKRR